MSLRGCLKTSCRSVCLRPSWSPEIVGRLPDVGQPTRYEVFGLRSWIGHAANKEDSPCLEITNEKDKGTVNGDLDRHLWD